ncbi:MAG: energy transducer TonB [Methylobacter sp.]|nr:energy transducer TonB [Methylobacter sp.]MDP2097715.1 energy transducer TonB [Methylobacter sp.]MDP2427207.1 energy transducer TonB [Methylobacter sp.]MDP3056694.1 energy transducer TonB [Methylobacter sp.]MDP3363638.1 energy transducer TonB [Methylobacter sp.]
MFTKIGLPVAGFQFLESRAPIMGNPGHAGLAHGNERPWLAPGLVLCLHLAAFAALRPQPQPLSVEAIPEPIMISLLSAPQAATQPPMPAVTPLEPQKNPVKKPVKIPLSKPVMPRIKKPGLPIAPPLKQTAMPEATTSAAVAVPKNQATNNRPVLSTAKEAADTQAYQSPNFNAAYLNNPTPNYPSISRRLGEQGLVLLLVQVTADGTAGSVELQTGSGSSRLDQAALEAVKKWRFTPAKRGEQPVSASVVVPVRFSIEG